MPSAKKLDATGEGTLKQNASSAPADLNPDGGHFILVEGNKIECPNAIEDATMEFTSLALEGADTFGDWLFVDQDAAPESIMIAEATQAAVKPPAQWTDGENEITEKLADGEEHSNLPFCNMQQGILPSLVNNMASYDFLPPSHWTGPSLAQDWNQGFSATLVDGKTLAELKKMVRVKMPSELGKGRDAQNYTRPYKDLEVYCAWRIENPDLWSRYVAERKIVEKDFNVLAANGAEFHGPLQTKLSEDAGALPDNLMQNVSEVRLLHGTKPENVLALLNNGLNDRLSSNSGMFNAGIYLAEDLEKVNQYTTPDSNYKAAGLEDLHAHLFRAGEATHPDDDIFYCFVVRTCLGAHLDTKGLKRGMTPRKMFDCETNEAVFQTKARRELVRHPASSESNPIHHHSLVVGLGKALKRFREFVVYTDKRVYIEYLIAYRRI